MKDFFISYTHADQEWAEWIAWFLEDCGYSTVIQAWDFRPGGNFILEIDKALRETERMIIVLSPEYINSAYASAEWLTFFQRNKKNDILLIRVLPCKIVGPLERIPLIDLTNLGEQIGQERILEGLNREGK